MNPIDTITISHNWWRVPSAERAFSGWLEGVPTAAQHRETIEEAIAARAAWKPCAEGMQLVEKLKTFIGFRIRIQFWDPIMWILDTEGAYPVDADCLGVLLQKDGDFLQAYLQVKKLKEHPTPEGYLSQGYFKQQGDVLLAPLADLYEVTKVGSTV